MAVKQSSTALDISSEGSPVMPSVRVLYQPKPLQQNRATAEMESAHQLVEELAGPLFQMQAVADGEAHQDGQHQQEHQHVIPAAVRLTTAVMPDALMMELTPMAMEQNPNKVGRLSSSLP